MMDLVMREYLWLRLGYEGVTRGGRWSESVCLCDRKRFRALVGHRAGDEDRTRMLYLEAASMGSRLST
jgi:hypothetical protein